MLEAPPFAADAHLTAEHTAAAPAWPDREAWADALGPAVDLALNYLATAAAEPVNRHVTPSDMAPRFDLPLPEAGCSPADAVREWMDRAEPGIVRSAGPRYFGFVTGGSTPAAIAGDWLASALDQNAATWLMSPAATQTELTVIRWLLDLFGLPADWQGSLTSGATMSNLTALAAARQWASRQLGFDAARDGLGGNPKIAVVSSSEIHLSAIKALGTLGLGRDAVVTVPAMDGVIDLEQFDATLDDIAAPVIVVANAAEVNTGAFDPIRAMGERLARHAPGSWLHVDGAFGLYAALSPEHAALLDGIELADSVATDAHKWLNVPYDCGAVFYRDSRFVRQAFGGSAAYFKTEGDEPIWNALEHVPEMSRRFRGLAVWCALRAAGRAGYRAVIEQSIANAGQFASWVAANPELVLLAPAHLNIVCFRAADPALTGKILEQVQRSGSAFISTTTWQGNAAIRAAFDNWSTTADDVTLLQSAVADALSTVQVAGTPKGAR